jgi:hypothetical protein
LNPLSKQKPLKTNAGSEKDYFFYMILKKNTNIRERVSKLEAKRLFNEEQFFLCIQHKSRNWRETVGDGD